MVLNVIAANTVHFPEEQELSPLAYAEQFVDPDPSKAQSPEELLRRARMIISTELGKDPILRQEIRSLFKSHAQVSVLPTERGISKITELDAFFVRVLQSRCYNWIVLKFFIRTSNTCITNLSAKCCKPRNFLISSLRSLST